VESHGDEVPVAAQAPLVAAVILLDTHALIWLDQDHARSRVLTRGGRSLHVSPATLLELQFLSESGRVRLPRGDAQAMAIDDRWTLDEPPAAAWFATACDFAWTRDPFDRLIAAHARLRGWRLATADETLLTHLGPRHTLDL
jgi:PIN domain nuclease of toxin-antitoxin system